MKEKLDHYIRSQSPNKGVAFDWDNLYLSLKQINNGKISNCTIPVSSALDPCSDSDHEIESHSFLKNAEISSYSPKDANNKKYQLNHALLVKIRLEKLVEFLYYAPKIKHQSNYRKNLKRSY
ncbi:MAG: hypothetical protein IPO48_20010 [Saprospiraceae bacterium]|nr:hypothetical protein [Saprospiraceae bacterium]